MAKFVAGKELLWTPIWITKNHKESISLYFRRYLKFLAYGSKWVFFSEKNTHSSSYRSFWVLNPL